MPGPRNLPPRSSQRRNASQQEEEPPMRTRSGRGSKSAGKADKVDIVSPKTTSSQGTGSPQTRRGTRAASHITNYATIDSAPDIYASYEEPFLMVFGLSREFLENFRDPKTPRKPRQSSRTEIPALNTFSSQSEEEEESSEESDDVPTSSHPAPRGRGRGGRGSRGGRGRGGRGRGRGGRGRGAHARVASPVRTRPARNAAPMFPLTEEDDEEPSNQNSPSDDAKDSPDPETEVMDIDEEIEEEMGKKEESDYMEDVLADTSKTNTPPGVPPPELVHAYHDPTAKIQVPTAIPKIALPAKSLSQTSRDNGSTPAEYAVPKLLDPEDDVLSDSDLPDPFLEGQPPPIEAECEDRADFLLKSRFKPMTDAQDIIAALTKYPLSQRSTESLYALAENTQNILKVWQDEYLMLDARTAPHAHPPKKPCNGGRIPMNPLLFEDMKEADLYGYTYDPKKPAGMQDPFTQRPGHEKSGGRELRQRRTRDMLDSAAPSEEEEEEEEGRPAKRQRRATRRFEGSDQGTGTSTPKKHNGWGGARKKGVSKYAQPAASATPEPDGRGKRGRAAAGSLLHQRIQEMREESAVTSSGDEGSSNANSIEDDEQVAPNQKRGRPMGSKNVGRRSDYGVKKGPRKRVIEEDVPVPSAHAPNAPPPLLQSLSDGQNQFTIDAPIGSTISPPVIGPHSTETVFQATPQPPGAPEASSHGRSIKAQTPDTYMNTTPLSQYSNPYVDESATNSASGSRKKPRVKSEKRSQSMTIWWAERKARQKELEEKNGTPGKPSTARSTPSSGRRGGRPPTASREPKLLPENQQRPTTSHAEPTTEPVAQRSPQDMYAAHVQPPPPPPFSAPSPSNLYTPGAYPPPNSMVMQSSPLAAVPSAPPPQGPVQGPPSSHPGPGRVLAPAPLPPQIPSSYPSPYGPRTAPRPKSNGPPPLAPAPPAPHITPYPPITPNGTQHREMPFKVMIPGPPPTEQRRPSR